MYEKLDRTMGSAIKRLFGLATLAWLVRWAAIEAASHRARLRARR